MYEYCGGCPDIRRRELLLSVFNENWFIGCECSINREFSMKDIVEIYDLKNDPLQLNNIIFNETINSMATMINYD